MTFTTLRPPPSGTDRSIISSDTGSAVRLPAAVRASRNTITPTADAAPSRTARRASGARLSNRSGSCRSTSTNSTVVSVSIATWVRARSAPPWTTNRPAIA